MTLQEWDISTSGGGANVKAGFESAVAENSTRAVTFNTAFSSTPNVVANCADSSSQLSFVNAHSVTVNGFTIQVLKSGGGGSANRDIAWIATDAGNP